jgi:hypothetical protein
MIDDGFKCWTENKQLICAMKRSTVPNEMATAHAAIDQVAMLQYIQDSPKIPTRVRGEKKKFRTGNGCRSKFKVIGEKGG